MKTLAFLLLGAVALADSSGLPSRRPREWRDADGRVIKRLDSWDRMLLYSYDEQGRVIQISLEGQRTHCFMYGEGSLLQVELDCVGRRHEFLSPREINLLAGTALDDHSHGHGSRSKTFEYDSAGRLTPLTPTGAKND